MVLAVRILGLQRKTKPKHTEPFNYYSDAFWGLWHLINKGFLNDTREFDQYIAWYNSGNMQQPHRGGPNEIYVKENGREELPLNQ